MKQPRQPLGRNFSLLLAGNVVSVLGSSVYLIVIILYLKETTGSATLLGFYNFVALLPPVLLGPFAGALADRWSRRSALVWSDAARGILMLLLAVAAMSPAGLSIALLLVITALAGICHALFLPAVPALIPEIVAEPQLKRANSLRAAGTQIGNMTGNAVGGLVFAVVGLVPVLVVNGVSFLLSALQESWIRVPTPPGAGGSGRAVGEDGSLSESRPVRGIIRQTVAGVRYLLRRRGLRALLLANSAVFLLSPPLLLVLPFVIEDTMGLPTAFVGLAFAVTLAGGIAAYLMWAAVTLSRSADMVVLVGSFAALALMLLLIALLLTPWVLFAGLLVSGAAIASINLMVNTVVQRTVPAGRRARVFSLIESVAALSTPFAYAASGVLIDALMQEIRLVFAVTGAVLAAAALLAAFSPGLRRVVTQPR
ncbi:MAG: MFS transporter [Spirochaetaceae bacterium]|nr:MAG: MFS transporter [Spirochaetaceae bacterium]